MAETTNQTRKLYGVETTWEVGKIVEYEIEKETEKTYVLRGCKGSLFSGHKINVRKSEMSAHSTQFAETYPAAYELAMQILRNRIKHNNQKVEYINADTDKCAALLKEYEEGRNNG